MRLRPRLALTLVAAAVPLVLATAWARGRMERGSVVQALREFAILRMETGGRERCEADPERFPEPSAGRRPDRGPRPGVGPPLDRRGPPPGGPPLPPPPPGAPPRFELWAYHPDFHSSNPVAPPFPADLHRALEAGGDSADGDYEDPRGGGLQIAMRMEWGVGPCAVVLARRPGPVPGGATRDLFFGAAVVGGGLLLVLLLAAGPLVGRIRRLTAEVRRSAAERYATPVEASGSDEVSDLASAFNEAGAEVRTRIEALERRETTLREFVANTTHDLAIPLTVLQGHIAELRRRAEAGETVSTERVLEAAEEAHYLASLVHNLAAAARLEAGETPLERRPVDLNALLDRVASRHRPVAAPRGIEVNQAVPEERVFAEGDETLLEQAVSNLVHNAVRYNREGGHVAAVLEAPADPPGTFLLRVADDGPGVPRDEMGRLAERAFRGGAARTRHPGGRGLGLHIARTVAERHGMSLAFRPREGGGLEAELRGPRSAAPK